MYQAQKALFLYCVSPVHMGAGTAIGLIDNPIQRERHTGYPMMAGSGLKGAVRNHLEAAWRIDPKDAKSVVARLFGPPVNASEHAGAVSFGDAQLVAFPVRCTKRAYVYATSPTALARLKRQLLLLGVDAGWTVPQVQEQFCRVVPANGPVGNNEQLHLEAFQYTAIDGTEIDAIADWLAQHAIPNDEAYSYFRDKLRADLVVLPDDDFGYFVRNATVVEPHVRIDDETGTADGGGLFYTENLPPESLLMAPLMVSRERRNQKQRNGEEAMPADEVLHTVLRGTDGQTGIDGTLLQVGGDATTGRGQVVLRAV